MWVHLHILRRSHCIAQFSSDRSISGGHPPQKRVESDDACEMKVAVNGFLSENRTHLSFVKKPSEFKQANHFNYEEEQDVLARWTDGMFYLGTILKVDKEQKRCYVKFEDDSEYWILFRHLQKGPDQGEIHCVLCQGEHSEEPNQIVLCDHCGIGYHQLCHNPHIEDEILKPNVEWLCRQCVFAATSKKGSAVKIGVNGHSGFQIVKAQVKPVTKGDLHYNPRQLHWDSQHKFNTEQSYCYCGGPGDWYRKMLQCCRCKQWFHEACVQCLEKPLLFGDRFFIFVCSICNEGPEYLKRLDVKWVDIAQLALFSLTVKHNKKYMDFEEVLKPWFDENWDDLQLGKLQDTPRDEAYEEIQKALTSNKTRFQSGREIRKKMTLWGLRIRIPPPPPTIILPETGHINDFSMSNLEMKGKKTKFFVPVQSNIPVAIKRRASSDLSDFFRQSKRARKLLENAPTVESLNGYHCGFAAAAANYSSNYYDFFKNTLERMIPRPDSFEGYNHPFKFAPERSKELEEVRMKERLLGRYSNSSSSSTVGYDSSDLNTDIGSETLSSLTSLEMGSDDSSSLLRRQTVSSDDLSLKTELRPKRRRGRPKKQASLSSLASISSQNSSNSSVSGYHSGPYLNNNIPKECVLNALPKLELSISHFQMHCKSSKGKAAESIPDEDTFEVVAHRKDKDGKLQYLIDWQELYL